MVARADRDFRNVISGVDEEERGQTPVDLRNSGIDEREETGIDFEHPMSLAKAVKDAKATLQLDMSKMFQELLARADRQVEILSGLQIPAQYRDRDTSVQTPALSAPMTESIAMHALAVATGFPGQPILPPSPGGGAAQKECSQRAKDQSVPPSTSLEHSTGCFCQALTNGEWLRSPRCPEHSSLFFDPLAASNTLLQL